MEKDFFHLGVKALIRNAIGEVLLLQRSSNGTWDLPGGCMTKEDSKEQTALRWQEQALRREVKEEIGVEDVRIGRHLGMCLTDIRIRLHDQDVGLIVSVFECSIPPQAPLFISDEHTLLDWSMPPQAASRLTVAKFSSELCALVMG